MNEFFLLFFGFIKIKVRATDTVFMKAVYVLFGVFFMFLATFLLFHILKLDY